MIIKYGDYNIPEVDLGTVTSGTEKECGTSAELAKISKIISRSGSMILKYKISTTNYSVLLHCDEATANSIHGYQYDVLGAESDLLAKIYTKTGSANAGKAFCTVTVTAHSNRTVADKTSKASK